MVKSENKNATELTFKKVFPYTSCLSPSCLCSYLKKVVSIPKARMAFSMEAQPYM